MLLPSSSPAVHHTDSECADSTIQIPESCFSILSTLLCHDMNRPLYLPLTPLQACLLSGRTERAMNLLTLAPRECGVEQLLVDEFSASSPPYTLNALHLAVLSGQISTVSKFMRTVKSLDSRNPHFTNTLMMSPVDISGKSFNVLKRTSISSTEIIKNGHDYYDSNFPLGKQLLLGCISTRQDSAGLTPSSLALQCRLPIISRELARFERVYKISG